MFCISGTYGVEMELRHLRYFMAVAETGSLSRASAKLFMAQPPLSVQIRQLEDELGVALFTRHPKGVSLTVAGQRLLPQAQDMLERAGRLADLGRNVSEQPGTTLAVGYVPSASKTVLPDLFGHLRRLQPLLRLELREMTSDEQIEALVAGRIDAGIARNVHRHVRVGVACETPDPFCLAVPSKEVRSRAPALDLRHFSEHSFVAFTRHMGPAYFDQSIHLCRLAGFSPRIRYEASTLHGVLDLVGAGAGVALVPATACLMGAKGLHVSPLRQSAKGEVLALLKRKSDANPLLPQLEQVVGTIFAGLASRMARVLHQRRRIAHD